jgi:hypothetical protein
VKPAFDDFVLPSKKYADVIIPRGGDNHVAIDLIVQHIRTKLGQHDLCKFYPNVYVVHTTFQVHLFITVDLSFITVLRFSKIVMLLKIHLNRYAECILSFVIRKLLLLILSFIQIA